MGIFKKAIKAAEDMVVEVGQAYRSATGVGLSADNALERDYSGFWADYESGLDIPEHFGTGIVPGLNDVQTLEELKERERAKAEKNGWVIISVLGLVLVLAIIYSRKN